PEVARGPLPMPQSEQTGQQLRLLRVAIISFGFVLLAVTACLYVAAESSGPALAVLSFTGFLLAAGLGGFGIHLAKATRLYRDWTGLLRITSPVLYAAVLARLFLFEQAAEPLQQAGLYLVGLYLIAGSA